MVLIHSFAPVLLQVLVPQDLQKVRVRQILHVLGVLLPVLITTPLMKVLVKLIPAVLGTHLLALLLMATRQLARLQQVVHIRAILAIVHLLMRQLVAVHLDVHQTLVIALGMECHAQMILFANWYLMKALASLLLMRSIAVQEITIMEIVLDHTILEHARVQVDHALVPLRALAFFQAVHVMQRQDVQVF
jgi:hypothetical protein